MLTVVALDLIFQVAYPTRLAFDVFVVCTSHCIEAPTRSVELRGEDSAALRASHAAAYSPVAILIFTRWFSAWTLVDTCGARGTGRRDVNVVE